MPAQAPTNENRTVQRRPSEYLTEPEVERLIDAARKWSLCAGRVEPKAPAKPLIPAVVEVVVVKSA